MLPILTPDESAALDRASADAGVSVTSLMESAGAAVARAATIVAGGAYGRRAVVVCGRGNNGGDGLVAARLLERAGMGVTVVLLDEPGAFAGPARTNFERFADAGGRWVELGRLDQVWWGRNRRGGVLVDPGRQPVQTRAVRAEAREHCGLGQRRERTERLHAEPNQ